MKPTSKGSESTYWYNRKWVNVLLHGAFWLLLFSLPQLLGNRGNAPREHSEKEQAFFWISNLLWMGLFYINIQWLIPKILYRKNLLTFITAHLLLLGIYLVVNLFLRSALTDQNHFNQRSHYLFTTIIYLFFTGASSTFRLVRDHMQADRMEREKRHENLKTELSFLRSQVSPHFMFNVLNNMVALARKKSDLLEPSLIKLSSLMRYMLYECNEKRVLLSKEVNYLQHYIDLERIRQGKNIQIALRIDGNLEDLSIAPLIFIPFLENSFKHGLSSTIKDEGYVRIQLQVKERHLRFHIENSKPHKIPMRDPNRPSGGIGLVNVHRRLNLLYPERYQLKIDDTPHVYSVELLLELD